MKENPHWVADGSLFIQIYKKKRYFNTYLLTVVIKSIALNLNPEAVL